jgi:FKBP-type peptidyl-prolyl cis-trans isomerase (trigger factor)
MAEKGDKVTCAFKCYLNEETTPIHQSENFVFVVGSGKVLPGFEFFVQMMEVGQTRECIL